MSDERRVIVIRDRNGIREVPLHGRAGLSQWANGLDQAAPPVVVDVESVWKPTEAAAEVGTPTNRALATLIRGAPLVALLLPVSMGLLWLLDAGWAWLLPLWGAISIAAYLAIVWLDLIHNSPASTERHRINKAAQLKSLELRQTHEIRRAIVETFLEHLEGRSDD